MARRWFSRKGLTCESETFQILTHTNDDALVNGSKILSAADLARAQVAAAVTLDGGSSVTTMTVRGASTLPANYKAEIGTVSVTLPAFSVSAVAAGTITTITLGQSTVKPAHDVAYSVPFTTASGLVTGKVVWNHTTGNFLITKIDGSAMTVNFGLPYDVTFVIN